MLVLSVLVLLVVILMLLRLQLLRSLLKGLPLRFPASGPVMQGAFG